MPVTVRKLEMCIVNPQLVGQLAELVGSQGEVMSRLGISWNTWVKIRKGHPVLVSVGTRLRTRIMGNVDAVSRFSREFPSAVNPGIDRTALETAFLLPVERDRRTPNLTGRSPKRSGEFASAPPS